MAVLERVPLRAAAIVAWGLARVWWWVVPIRRKEAVDQLAFAIPSARPKPVLIGMMYSIILGYFEFVRYRRGGVEVQVDVRDVEPGSLLLCGHSGAWDVCLLAIAERLRLAVYFRTPHNVWVRDRVAEVRARHDVVALDTGTTLADAYAVLATGRCVVFVQDQRHAKGPLSPFFGRPAHTSAGFAAAVLNRGRPVYCAWGERLGVGRHRVIFRRWAPPALTGDRAADVQALTDAANQFYETSIRARPDSWFWLHRRWR